MIEHVKRWRLACDDCKTLVDDHYYSDYGIAKEAHASMSVSKGFLLCGPCIRKRSKHS